MLNLNAITVRLGGRTILDGASASLPPGGRVGLIGRNGAGKSTLMRVVAGQIDPDGGAAEMPRSARIGYIAQETPAGSATPFETVLAADVERARLLHEAEETHDAHRLGDIHDRLNAIGAHAAPAKAARILVGLGFDEAMQHRPLDSFLGRLADARRARRFALLRARTCCCSTSRRTISTSKRRCGSRISSRATGRRC